MRKLLPGLFFLNSLFLYSIEWPVENRYVVAAFGEKRDDHYHGGIDIAGGRQSVVSVSEGKIVYYHEEHSSDSQIPSGKGSFIVIEHERSLRTSYSHLEKGSIVKNRENVYNGEKIGVTGDTGASNGKYLHFEVVDGELNQVINPMKLLPANRDKVKPVIRQIYIQQNNTKKLLSRSERLKTGSYNLIVQVYDVSEYVDYFCPTSPYIIAVYLNGEEIRKIVYDSLVKVSRRVVMLGNYVNDYYDSDEEWLVDIGEISLKPGTIRLELSVKDFAGNETIKDRLITVYK